MKSTNRLLVGIVTLALSAVAIVATPTDAEALCQAQQMSGLWRNVNTTATVGYIRIDFPCPDTAPSTAPPPTMTVYVLCGLPYYCYGKQALSYKFFSEPSKQYTHAVASFSSDSGDVKETFRAFLLEDGRLFVSYEKKYALNQQDDVSKVYYFVK
jgi:hypothetical protein